MAPCPRGWRSDAAKTTELARLSVDTGFWPSFEVENGEWRMTMPAKTRNGLTPVVEFLKPQGRFKHLFKPGNEALLEEIQEDVNEYYAYLQRRCAETAA